MARRELQEINAGSMADIAFLLLIFFLVATTMDIDTGISRLLPPYEKDQKTETKVKERNVLVVLINKDDQLMVGGEISGLNQLKEKTIQFFSNPNNDPNLPEMKNEEIDFPPGTSSRIPDGKAIIPVSQGVVSLQNDRSTTYGKYLVVQDVLVAAVDQLRNEFAVNYFGRRYDQMDSKNPVDDQIMEGIRKVYKMNISEAEPKNIGGIK